MLNVSGTDAALITALCVAVDAEPPAHIFIFPANENVPNAAPPCMVLTSTPRMLPAELSVIVYA